MCWDERLLRLRCSFAPTKQVQKDETVSMQYSGPGATGGMGGDGGNGGRPGKPGTPGNGGDGANVKVDEAAEERKGGADDLGKAFLSAGETQLAIIFHVPKELAERKGVTMQDWMDALLAPVKDKGMQVVEQTEEVDKVIVPANPDGDAFPLKMRDECTGCGFAFLRERGLIPADDSSDDDVNYAEAAGVEW